MKKIAVVIYGPPGSGKGTQANFLAAKLGLIHFDTGKVLEAFVHDPERKNDKIVARERKLFDSGILMTPSFVTRVVKREVERIAQAGWGVVFSGSPRTLYEAERLLPVLVELYGKKNIYVFELRIPDRMSIRRNSARVICRSCKAPLLTEYYPSKNPRHCPVCGGRFYRRTLDNPGTIKIRLKEYKERTMPIFALMKKGGFRIAPVYGGPAPYQVYEKIHGHIKNSRRN